MAAGAGIMRVCRITHTQNDSQIVPTLRLGLWLGTSPSGTRSCLDYRLSMSGG